MNKNTKDYQLYFIQSTLVYVGTILAYFFLFPFFWINGVTPAIAIGIVAVGISLLSIYLNFKSYFAAASFIFLVSLSLLNGYATYLIGIDSGIMYVYLNLIGLAIFTNWHNRYKIMMISSIAIFALFD